jgi:hypothetical protein
MSIVVSIQPFTYIPGLTDINPAAETAFNRVYNKHPQLYEQEARLPADSDTRIAKNDESDSSKNTVLRSETRG